MEGERSEGKESHEDRHRVPRRSFCSECLVKGGRKVGAVPAGLPEISSPRAGPSVAAVVHC